MLYSLFLILAIVVLDQLSKFLIVALLPKGGAHTILHGVVSLQYHENTGAAWGLFSEQRWIFMSVSTLAIVFIIAYLIYTRKENHNYLFITSLAFFAGGGIGNMIDRIYLGYVIDFIKLDFIDFPIFNVADSFITVGAGLMILYIILDTIKDYKSKKTTPKVSDENKKS